LDHLQAAEFLYEASLFPDLEYTFKHALTHEVAYGSVLQDRRRRLHARIVQAIEALYPERLAEQVERLAHHAVRGELHEQAVTYLRQAGLKALTRSAPQDAAAWLEQALGLLGTLPEARSVLEQAFEIRLELRPALTILGDVRRALEHLREADVLAERLDDAGRRGQVLALMVVMHALIGELDEALVAGAGALDIAARRGDMRLRLLATTFLEQAHYYRGDHCWVVELATENMTSMPADWAREGFGSSMPISMYDRYWLVMSLAELGRFAEATEREVEAIQIAEPTQHAESVGRAQFAGGRLHLLRGDWLKARSRFEHGLTAYRSGNIGLSVPHAVAASAWVLAQIGEADEALRYLREGEQLLLDRPERAGVDQQSADYHALARAGLLLHRLQEARRFGELAVDSSPDHPAWKAYAIHLLGDVATHPEQFDAERGETYYRQALALAEPRSMRPLVAHCHLGLGKLCARTGKREQAREHLTTATTMYREMDMPFWLQEAESHVRDLG